MSKVTSKYQVSIPKALAEKIGIRAGGELARAQRLPPRETRGWTREDLYTR